jgi:cation:H+ antiporter
LEEFALVLIWLKFALCVLIIFFSGRAVARYGDVIANKTGIGGMWVGVVLLAVVTSLPELFTGISAITIVGEPDLTVGDLFGANTFNLLNLALLDIAFRNGVLPRVTSLGHRVTGWCSLSLVLVVAVSIFVSSPSSTLGVGRSWIGWYTPLLIILYIIFMSILFRFERSHPSPQVPEPAYEDVSLKKVYVYFGIAAAFVIGAGIWLAMIGAEIAEVTNLGKSFVGSIFLAFTTSLPEITVSFTAARMGAIDMAVANMIGSNLFNITIISVDDLLYTKGPVLAHVSESHLITALVVILMTGLFIVGLHFKPRRFFRFSWWNCALVVLFFTGAYFSYRGLP